MGLFSKRETSASHRQQQSAHQFNDPWFERWWDTIITDSGVSPDDPQNRLQLIVFTHKLLDDSAESYFSQLHDAAARQQYQSLASNPSITIEKKIDFLVGWNPQVPALLNEKFTNFKDLLTKSGQQHGRLRFFPSECCGEPLEIDPQTADRICSACGRRSA